MSVYRRNLASPGLMCNPILALRATLNTSRGQSCKEYKTIIAMMAKTMAMTWETVETIKTKTTETTTTKRKISALPTSSSNAAVLQAIGMEGILKLSVLQPIWESLRCLWDSGKNLGSRQRQSCLWKYLRIVHLLEHLELEDNLTSSQAERVNNRVISV